MSDSRTLLDPAFVRELEALERRLRPKARSRGTGEHRGTRRGGSAEFADHRAYEPGDDLRRVDWMAYARTGTPVVKLFRTDEDVLVRVVVDTSASMGFGTPSKLDVAQRFAAATAYLALAASERTEAAAAKDGALVLHGPVRGRGKVFAVLRSLLSMRADGKTALARSLDQVAKRGGRPGMLVVVSDFLDGGSVERALLRAGAAGHDVAIVQVLTPEEIAPPFEGDVTLRDAETGEGVDLTIDPEMLRGYAARLAGVVEGLRTVARRTGGTYVRVRTDELWQSALRRLVLRAIDAPLPSP